MNATSPGPQNHMNWRKQNFNDIKKKNLYQMVTQKHDEKYFFFGKEIRCAIDLDQIECIKQIK